MEYSFVCPEEEELSESFWKQIPVPFVIESAEFKGIVLSLRRPEAPGAYLNILIKKLGDKKLPVEGSLINLRVANTLRGKASIDTYVKDISPLSHTIHDI